MSESKRRIIVVGAGYAGILAAIRFAGKARRQNVQITLVSALDTFVERVRLHQYAAAQPVKRRLIADIVRSTGISFVQATVSHIDAHNHEIVAQTGPHSQRLPYDFLLYTLGSTTDLNRVPGVREYAYTLTPIGPRSADALRTALPRLNSTGGRLVVVGAGATGIEAAAELAEAYPGLQVRLVTRGEPSAFLGSKIQAHVIRTLQHLGVTIQGRTTITQVNPHELVAADGEKIPFDICVWAGGFAVPTLAREAGLAVNERDQVLIDPYMRSISQPDIYAAGDCAYPVQEPGVPVRMAAFTAAVTGAHAADCLYNALSGRPPKPLGFAYVGQGIALGRHDAVGFNTYPDDRPNSPIFTGWVAVQLREFFVNFLASLPGFERRWPGFFFWIGKDRGKSAVFDNSRRETKQSGVSA